MKNVVILIFILTYHQTLCAQKKFAMVNHIAFDVTNLRNSNIFYQNIIGLDSIGDPFHDDRHIWFKIAEHAQLHLIEVKNETATHYKGTHLCFSVPSMDLMINRLNQNNISFENWQGTKGTFTVRPDGVKQIYFQDPDGYWIEINNDTY